MIHNPISADIAIDQTQGKVLLEIESGFACTGNFALYYTDGASTDPNPLFFNRANSIRDDINDIFLLPFSVSDLQQITLYIKGKYSPAPNRSQIAVSYDFYQLQTDNVTSVRLVAKPKNNDKIAVTTNDPYDRFLHIFSFI